VSVSRECEFGLNQSYEINEERVEFILKTNGEHAVESHRPTKRGFGLFPIALDGRQTSPRMMWWMDVLLPIQSPVQQCVLSTTNHRTCDETNGCPLMKGGEY
jgi:hypothetical protein